MSNVRFVFRNLADAATITASSTAGALSVNNLKSELKGLAHRSTSTLVTYSLVWESDQVIGAVAIPACNLTNSATVTVTILDSMDSVIHTVTQAACPGSLNTSDAITANQFSYGKASKVVVWLPKVAGVRKLDISIDDAANPAGFIDSARLVVGDYWQPVFGAGYSAEYVSEDLSQSQRTDAGDLLTSRKPVIERITFSLNAMNPSDRAHLTELVRSCGVYKNFLVSLAASDSDSAVSHDCLVYGKRQNSAIRFETYQAYSSQFTIESW
jgi:hypothetical protein